MKKTLIVILCLMGLVFTVSNARAAVIGLTYGDAFYVGFVAAAEPADPPDELAYVTNLASLAPGTGNTVIDGYTYNRIASTITPTPSPTAFIGKNEISNSWIATTDDPFYIIGKYDGPNFGDWVWLVDGTIGDTFNLPITGGGYGLSHISAFSTNGTSVPEPGALLLLGFGLAGVAVVRKKIKK